MALLILALISTRIFLLPLMTVNGERLICSFALQKIMSNFETHDITVRSAEFTDRSAWNEYVAQHTNATAYHWFEWMEAVEIAYQHQPKPLIAFKASPKGAQVCGILPSVLMQSPGLGRRLCSLPFCDIGGPLADNYDVERQLIEAASNMLVTTESKGIELRTGAAETLDEDAITYYLADPETRPAPKVQMLLELPENSEILWKNFKSKLRSQIRKAEKNGLSCRSACDGSLIGDFYKVLSRNMRDLGSPVHSVRLYEALQEKYQDRARIHIVYSDSTPIAGGFVIRHPSRISIPWASTIAEFNHLSPNMMLYWDVIETNFDSNQALFDFGRSTLGEGTYRFKKQWGAKPYMLQWQSLKDEADHMKVRSQNDRRYIPQEPSKGISSFAKTAVLNTWKRLPVPLATAIGPLFRKHISL